MTKPIREPLMKSARAGSEGLCPQQRMENGGILYVFPIFHPAAWEQKTRCSAADDLFRGSLETEKGRSIWQFG